MALKSKFVYLSLIANPYFYINRKESKCSVAKSHPKTKICPPSEFRVIPFDVKHFDPKFKSCEGRIQSTKSVHSTSYNHPEKNQHLSRSVSLQGTWSQKNSQQSG